MKTTDTHAPLTPLQQFFWTRQQSAPSVPLYNYGLAFAIDGALDPDRFRAAFQAVLDGTGSLRTVIDVVAGRPVQRVTPPYRYPLDVVDLSGYADPDAACASWCRARMAHASDLRRRPFDAALVRLAPERFVWYLNQHHILADGWSTGLIYARVADFYAALGRSAPPPPTSFPAFHDQVAAAQPDPHSPRYQRARAYWQDRLTPQPESPVFYTAATARQQREHTTTIALGLPRTARLDAAARALAGPAAGLHLARHTLLATTLLAYLYRVGGLRRIALGALFHNRITARERRTTGLFQKALPLLAGLDAAETTATLFEKVLAVTREALWHRHYEPGTTRHPSAFDVTLNYLPMSFAPFAGHPTRVRWLPNGISDGRHSLSVVIHAFSADDGLCCHLAGNAGVFTPASLQQAATHLGVVLDQAVADPQQPLADLVLTTETERRQVLHTFNRTHHPGADATPAAALFEAQVGRTPMVPAVIDGAAVLTYAQLNAAANRLAHHLQRQGVGPGVVVALCAERSAAAVVALLAVMKAGGAYLPLDPAYPAERLVMMLEDSRAAVLLTPQALAGRFAGARTEARHLDLDALPLDGLPTTDPPGRAAPHDPCYLIYTSGSTGRPKGVVMPQRALANLVMWQMKAATRLQAPRTLQYTPLSFDVSLQEIFATWCAGGTLVLLDEATRRDPVGLLRHLDAHAIEQLYLTPTALQQLAQAAVRSGPVPTALREVICAGEALQITPAIRSFFAQMPEARLHNQYGPSETHIVTGTEVAGQPDQWPDRPGIGGPLWNTTAYILDDRMRLVPPGVVGELYIGGVQVATGYLHRPTLTAERFLDDPFSPGRMYRTGDLARFLPDGTIAFLGRRDHQVKIRGYRIELGEIEAVLATHPAVREAVVVTRHGPGHAGEHAGGGAAPMRLVAYVVLHPDAAGPAVLRPFLLQKLPAYMVPAAFVALAALPQTASGKVDRRGLPAPPPLQPAHLAPTSAPPQTATEQAIAAIWQEVLGVGHVGLEDDFFSLGGDSLLLGEVHHRLGRLLAIDLPIVALFQYPTVGALAQHLHRNTPAGDDLHQAAARRAQQQQAALQQQQPR